MRIKEKFLKCHNSVPAIRGEKRETMKFRLIGCTMIFNVVSFYTVLYDVACVEGISLDGTKMTRAQVEDVIFI